MSNKLCILSTCGYFTLLCSEVKPESDEFKTPRRPASEKIGRKQANAVSNLHSLFGAVKRDLIRFHRGF
jgi:hypothetical protein